MSSTTISLTNVTNTTTTATTTNTNSTTTSSTSIVRENLRLSLPELNPITLNHINNSVKLVTATGTKMPLFNNGGSGGIGGGGGGCSDSEEDSQLNNNHNINNNNNNPIVMNNQQINNRMYMGLANLYGVSIYSIIIIITPKCIHF